MLSIYYSLISLSIYHTPAFYLKVIFTRFTEIYKKSFIVTIGAS